MITTAEGAPAPALRVPDRHHRPTPRRPHRPSDRQASLRFGVLGVLDVAAADGPIDLRGPKLRALTAVLALNPNQVVSADRLIEALWGDDPPSTAPNTLQTYVSRLRTAVGPGVVETRAPGYVLAVDREQIDAFRFERLVGEAIAAFAAGDADRASALLEDALGLWRGEPLAEFAFDDFAQLQIVRLQEARLTATEEWAEAQLALGRHAETVPTLSALVAQHPLRERLCAQLILALYRSGRQSDALRSYAELRRNLGDELGIEPTPALRRLEEAVLLQRSDLEWEGPAPEVRAARAGTAPAAVRQDTPLPPRFVRTDEPFVGRERELALLVAEQHRAAEDGPRLVLLEGEPGVGKTRLAAELGLRLHQA
ncbi:MAG: winged helix-turn-helix domain-containing protein, partial [Actinomycetota bacterium]|nr:winged helix-turn-helix domain-containing protein [Actinomycetota bacterium]